MSFPKALATICYRYHWAWEHSHHLSGKEAWQRQVSQIHGFNHCPQHHCTRDMASGLRFISSGNVYGWIKTNIRYILGHGELHLRFLMEEKINIDWELSTNVEKCMFSCREDYRINVCTIFFWCWTQTFPFQVIVSSVMCQLVHVDVWTYLGDT